MSWVKKWLPLVLALVLLYRNVQAQGANLTSFPTPVLTLTAKTTSPTAKTLLTSNPAKLTTKKTITSLSPTTKMLTTLSPTSKAKKLTIELATTTILRTIDLPQEYWVQTDLRVPRIVNIEQQECQQYLSQALARVTHIAFRRQQAKHLGREDLSDAELALEPASPNLCLRSNAVGQNSGQKSGAEATDSEQEQRFQVKIVKITRSPDSIKVTVIYTVWYNQQPITADIVTEDFKLVTEMSAHLGFEVLDNKVYKPPELEEQSKLWIIGVVIGGVIALLLFGWCILFAYYNTCGRAFELSSKSVKVKDQRVPSIVSSQPISGEQTGPWNISAPQKPARVLVKEQKVQTDRLDDLRLATQLKDYLDNESQTSDPRRQPYYSTVAKTPKPDKDLNDMKWQTEVDKVFEVEKETKKFLPLQRSTTDSSLLKELKQTESNFSPEHKKNDSKSVFSDSENMSFPTVPVTLNLADLSDPYWTWHKAGDQVEQLFHIKQKHSSESSHPRPRPPDDDTSDTNGGTLSFHTRELQTGGSHLTEELKAKIVREQYMTGLFSVV